LVWQLLAVKSVTNLGIDCLRDAQCRRDIPWQEFVNPICRMVGDAREDMTQICFQINAVELRGND